MCSEGSKVKLGLNLGAPSDDTDLLDALAHIRKQRDGVPPRPPRCTSGNNEHETNHQNLIPRRDNESDRVRAGVYLIMAGEGDLLFA